MYKNVVDYIHKGKKGARKCAVGFEILYNYDAKSSDWVFDHTLLFAYKSILSHLKTQRFLFVIKVEHAVERKSTYS